MWHRPVMYDTSGGRTGPVGKEKVLVSEVPNEWEEQTMSGQANTQWTLGKEGTQVFANFWMCPRLWSPVLFPCPLEKGRVPPWAHRADALV